MKLVRAMFSPEHFSPHARLVLLRHVLEHIARPVEFLSSLRSVLPEAPLFVEVPELGWITSHGAFWDFCYEHCNYFTPETLRYALARAGFRVDEQRLSFGEQYQWVTCRISRSDPATEVSANAAIPAVQKYAMKEGAVIEGARTLVADARKSGPCVLWGMSTKGVVFASLIGGDLFAGGVDINQRKQGQFAPGTGLAIHAPEWLRDLGPGITVLVMNPNYLEEIRRHLAELGVIARLVAL